MSVSGTSSPEHKEVPPAAGHDELLQHSTSSRRAPASTPRRTLLFLSVIAGTVVVLGIALGLGLGLGLRHHYRNDSTSTSTPSSSSGGGIPSNLATVGTPDSSAAFLSMDLANAAPTTRTFNFVVEERRGAPDGIERRMLVVNGEVPSMRAACSPEC